MSSARPNASLPRTDARRRPAALVFVAALLALITAGCSSSGAGAGAAPSVPAGDAATLTVYSGQHEQTVRQLVEGFTKSTGVKVALRSANEAELSNQIVQEGSSSPADVFYAGNPPAIEALGAKNLLAPVDAGTLAAVSGPYNSARGDWVGVSARSGALIYNTGAVQPAQLPTSLLDLASAAWKGRFAFAPTETDFGPIVTAISKLKGESAARAFLAGLKANGKAYADNEAIVAAVNRGEVATGLVEHYYWYRLQAEEPGKVRSALHYFGADDPGALLAVSGAGVLRSSRNQQAGQRFLAYLVSAAGQTILASSQSFEYPLGSGVVSRQPLRPLSELKPPQLRPGDLGDGKQALKMLQDAGLL